MSIPFISDALAAGTTTAADASAAPQGSGLNTIIMLLVFIGVFYFLLIRPQTKRNREQKALMDGLQKGDEVVTSGGILGRIVKIEDNIVTLALNELTEIRIQKNAIVAPLPKGSLKKA